nr:histidine kinase N-terminal 7TM domain-containing protein [Clostridium saccharobutylicum]
MNYYFSLILILSSLTLIYIGYFAWNRRKKYISISLIAISIHGFGYAFEILCTNIEWVKFWVKVEYLGSSFFGVLWLVFALCFTGKTDKIKKGTLALLYVISITILIVNWTNDFHHLFYKEMYMNNKGIFPILEVIHGPWYWIHIVYNYLVTLIGLIIFILDYINEVSVIRKQLLLIIISCVIPWIADVIYSLGLAPFDLDLCPIALSISGIMYSCAVVKFKLLKLTPIALEKVFSSMLEGVIILDNENNIVNFNNSSKGIIHELNYINQGDKQFEEVFKEYEDIIRAVNSNEYKEGLISLKNKNELKFYKMSINYIYEKNRNILGKILILSDITKEKKQQENLLELNTFKDNLFKVVSHDVKSPLGVLLSLLELLEDENDIYKEENREVLSEIKANVKNTYEMVENVLQWFGSQMDGMVYRNLTWKLFDIMKNSLMLLEKNAQLKGIKVNYEISRDIFVNVDREMFEIVVRNLFSNAVKFTNSGGYIKIWAEEVSGVVTIAVKDSGIGIENEKLDALFDNSNYCSTFGTAGEKGTGIGLMICKQFIEKNNGDIWAESSYGKGSTFYFTILSGKNI